MSQHEGVIQIETSCWNTLWTIYEFNPRDIWKYRQSREIKIILKIKFPNLWPLGAFVLNKLHMHNTEVQSFLFVCCYIKKIFVKSPHNVCHTQLLLFHWSDVFHKKKKKTTNLKIINRNAYKSKRFNSSVC